MDLQTLDLDRLPKKPKPDGYEWTGKIGDYECVFVADTRLKPGDGTLVLDTRDWNRDAAPVAFGRRRRFQERIPSAGGLFLVCVFKNIGTEGKSKRGGWKFTALFRVLDRGDMWVYATMLRRSK